MKFKFPKSNKTIYCIPNRYGFTIFGVFGVFILAGAAYSNNLIFMLGFFVLSFAFTSIMQTARTIRNIEILSITLQPEAVGKTTGGKVLFKNPSNQYKPRFRFEIEELEVNFIVEEIPPNETLLVNFIAKLPATRGKHSLDFIRLSSSSPYGMFKAWMYLKRNDEYFVYPRMSGKPDLPLEPDSLGENFSNHRLYTSSDNFSRIDWKVYARTGNTWVKEFKESATKMVYLDWDAIPVTDGEAKISQMALWLNKAHHQQLDFGLKIPNFKSNIQNGLHHYHQCMKELSVLKL